MCYCVVNLGMLEMVALRMDERLNARTPGRHVWYAMFLQQNLKSLSSVASDIYMQDNDI